jgi:hypothetical protein
MNSNDRTRRNSFIHGEQGAVTIYVILIIVPIFIFQAVLIDFVRIKVASMEAEQATRAAARSVLSAYDKKLIDYGLFGLKASEEERKSIANHVLTKYGTDGSDSSTFQWITLQTLEDQTRIVPTYSLGDHRFFKQQILEDMKYKAPIEFTRNIYDKWKGKKNTVDETENEVQDAKDLDELLKQREKKLEHAFVHVEQIMNSIENATSTYESKLSDYDSDGENEEILEQIIASLQHQFHLLLQQQDNMSAWVLEAEQIEHRMLEQWNGQWNEQGNEQTNSKLNDAYILGDEFYSAYKWGAAAPISAFGAFINQLSVYHNDGFELVNTEAYTSSFQAWYTFRVNEENRRIAAFERLEEKKREQKKNIKNQMEQAKQTAIAQICTNVNAEQYSLLNSYYEQYLSFNNGISEQELDPSYALDQVPEQYQTNSFSLLTRLMDVLESIRDEAYVNEYAMYYFNHRTTSQLGLSSPIQEKLKSHSLQDQEVEYILYGLSSCTTNRIAAYSEMYSIRFAIQFIESLMDARKSAVGLGSPLLMVLIATAEASVKAYRDMERLIRGEDVQVMSKWGRVTMNYADYLRLFLIVHSNETKKQSRIQALIQLNTQVDLLQRPSYIELKSTINMNLWFLRNEHYQIKKTAAMSY